VRAQQDGRPALGARDARQQVARVRPGLGSGVVLLDLEPERTQLVGERVRDRALVL
jgi:hypothetical protein